MKYRLKCNPAKNALNDILANMSFLHAYFAGLEQWSMNLASLTEPLYPDLDRDDELAIYVRKECLKRCAPIFGYIKILFLYAFLDGGLRRACEMLRKSHCGAPPLVETGIKNYIKWINCSCSKKIKFPEHLNDFIKIRNCIAHSAGRTNKNDKIHEKIFAAVKNGSGVRIKNSYLSINNEYIDDTFDCIENFVNLVNKEI